MAKKKNAEQKRAHHHHYPSQRDFDALASMLAAQKLYPEALVYFQAPRRKTCEIFLLIQWFTFSIWPTSKTSTLLSIESWYWWTPVSRVRIGKLADILSRPDLEIHIFVHHPSWTSDIRGHFEAVHPTGATVKHF
jgi:tRNA nucleotidyltransferase (CCA-adding enzyme)